jgi:hypothetical protein
MTAVSARIRFGAVRSRAVPRYTLTDTVRVWCDFYDPGSGAAVEVSSVSARIWLPGGAQLDPEAVPVREGVGVWYVDVTPTFEGLWRVEMFSAVPDAAASARDFLMVSAVPAGGPVPDPTWAEVDAQRIAAAASAAQAAASASAAEASAIASAAAASTAANTAIDTRFPGWTFTQTAVKSAGQSITDGQFYYRNMGSKAAFRVQGLGGITGFMCSAFQTPVQFVLHRAEGGQGAGEELPVGNNTNLMSFQARGTVDFSDGQGRAFELRILTKEDAAVTGAIGSRALFFVAKLGEVIPSGITFEIDADNGLYFRGTKFVDGTGTVITSSYASNPSFDLWQSGTSFAIAASTNTFLADRYKTRRAATGATHSRQTGFSGAQYCIRMARDNGNSSVQALLLFQQFDPELVRKIAGQTVRVSADMRVGADYSGGAVVASFYSGTAGNEAVTMLGASAGFTTGGVTGSNISMGTPTTTAARAVGASSYTIPADALDLAMRIFWTPSGTAGAADFLEITNIRISEAGTTFVPADIATVLDDCRRFYRTGTARFPAPLAGAVTQRSPTVLTGAAMRAVPNITLASPVSGAQVRDVTAGADCSATASANVDASGFTVSCTGNASTAAGNELAVVWTADARL